MNNVFLCEEVPPKRKGDGVLWRFFCDHCRTCHHHGAGEGLRVAHCRDLRSPYRRSGYYLKRAEAP